MNGRQTKFSEIDFSSYDYLIDGKPLHEKIFKGVKAGGPSDFGVEGSSHMASSVFCQPNAVERLSGEARPDLNHDLTSLYLCGFCGGYETAIGASIVVGDDIVYWNDIGFGFDCEKSEEHTPFDHLPNYCFSRENYSKFIQIANSYKVA